MLIEGREMARMDGQQALDLIDDSGAVRRCRRRGHGKLHAVERGAVSDDKLAGEHTFDLILRINADESVEGFD